MHRLLPIALVLCFGPAAHAGPKPKPNRGQYDLDVIGLNEGEPFRLTGADAEAILSDPDAKLFQFQSTDWMSKNQRGTYVRVLDVTARFPERPATELVRVFRLDAGARSQSEILLIPTAAVGDVGRFAPTFLRVGPDGMEPLWAASELPGERFRVLDIRDLNADLDPEVMLGGESGQSGFYQFSQVVARAGQTFQTLSVQHVDALVYLDLDRDGRVEVVVRERVGRKGNASQWTYIDRLERWTGQRFEPAIRLFPRYHDEQTLPTLIGDLIDNHDAARPILEEKIAAIGVVRDEVASWTTVPKSFHAKKVAALNQLQRNRLKVAKTKLEALAAIDAHDPQVMLGLAQVRAAEADWEGVLAAGTRALSVDPRAREAWWLAGLAFSGLKERSSAVACFHLAIALCGARDQGVAFLRARRGEPGMDSELQAIIDEAIARAR